MIVDRWHFDWTTSWDDVWSPDFLALWKGLENEADPKNVFFEPSLVRAWVDAYRPVRDMAPRFLVAESTSGARVFFPLVYSRLRWKDAWRRSITPVGFSDFDYHDPLIQGDMAEVRDSFWPAFEKNINQVWMRSCDQLAITGVRPHCLPDHSPYPRNHAAPWIDLSGTRSLDDFLSRCGRKLRTNVNHRIRRLKREGDFRFRHFLPWEAGQVRDQLPCFLKLRKQNWPSAFTLPDLFENMVKLALAGGLLHFSVLTFNSRTISCVFAFLHGNRFYYYIPVFDRAFAQYAPGKVHLAMLINQAIERNVAIFDLLRGREPYKMEWTQHVNHLCGLEIIPKGVRAAAGRWWAEQIRPRAGQFRSR